MRFFSDCDCELVFSHNVLHRSQWCCRSRIVWTLELSPLQPLCCDKPNHRIRKKRTLWTGLKLWVWACVWVQNQSIYVFVCSWMLISLCETGLYVNIWLYTKMETIIFMSPFWIQLDANFTVSKKLDTVELPSDCTQNSETQAQTQT